MIYLDYNATAPLLPEARSAMEPWLGVPSNPSAAHRLGRDAAMAVDRARDQVAALVEWPRDGVIFTSGATESNGVVLSRGRWAVSAVEHPSAWNWRAVEMGVDGEGILDPTEIDRLEVAGTEAVTGVAVMFANNETGVIQRISEVIRRARARGLRVHVDAAQAPGRIPLGALVDADSVTLSAHKIGGPQGVGALLVRAGREPEPLLRGAAQERGWRPGTHNVAGIVGFGAACSVAARALVEAPRLARLRDRLEEAARGFGARIASHEGVRLPNTACIGFEGVAAADLVIALDLRGIAVSAGAACSSGAQRPSRVLAAMRFPGSGVRFSLGTGTTEAEIDTVIAALHEVLPMLRNP